MQYYQSEPAYVKFDYNIPRGASIGVYARRNALPTHTQYHFNEVLSGLNARKTRSTHVRFFNLSIYRKSYIYAINITNFQYVHFNRSLIFLILQQPLVSREITRYMEPGHWFISLYNDDGDEQEITFYAAAADDMTQNCPSGCSGNGQCLLGHCQCLPGFTNADCSESKCREAYPNYFVIFAVALQRHCAFKCFVELF